MIQMSYTLVGTPAWTTSGIGHGEGND